MKKILKYLIVMFIMISLSGCKLADEQNQQYREPQIIGYYFTYEHVSTTDQSEKRLGTIVDDKITFGYDGISMFTYIKVLPCDDEFCPTYYVDQIDNAVFDYNSKKDYINDKNYTTFIEGTVYIGNKILHDRLYANWVYEDSEGNVSISPVTSSSIQNGKELNNIIIGANRQTFDPIIQKINISKSEIGESKIYYEFYACYRIPLEYYLVHQVDNNQQFLATTKLVPNQYPDSFVKETDTEYIILESYNITEDGETIIEREIIDKNAKEMNCIQLRDTGVYEEIKIKLK